MKINVYNSLDNLSLIVYANNKFYSFHAFDGINKLDFAFKISKQFILNQDDYADEPSVEIGRLILSVAYNL